MRGAWLLAWGMAVATAAGNASGQRLVDLELTGRYQELEQVVEKRLEREPRSTSLVASLCIAYSKVKRYGRLFDCLDDLERRIAAGDWKFVADRGDISDSDATPLPHLLRAEAFLELGDYARAAEQARTAMSRVREHMIAGVWPPKMYQLQSLGILALSHALAGQADAAGTVLKELEEFSIGFLGRSVFVPLRTNAVARVYMALRDYPKVREATQAEAGLWDRQTWWMNNLAWGYSGGDGRETLVVLPKLLMRGISAYETKDIEAAKAALDGMLRHNRIRDFGELHWLALYYRALVDEAEKDLEGAIRRYREAVEVIDQQRASISSESSKIGFVGDKQAPYGRLVLALAARGAWADALEAVERSKARALVDLLASKKDFVAPDAPKVREILARLDEADLASRAVEFQSAGARPAAVRTLALARSELAAAAPETASLVTVGTVPVGDLQRRLPPDETLVEFFYHSEVLLTFVLSSRGLTAVQGDARGLAAQVASLRKAVGDPADPEWRPLAIGLYERLWKPIARHVSTEKVLVVPHGALHYLPFGALQEEGGRVLLEAHAIRLLPSASVLRFLRPPVEGKSSAILALGNPDLDDAKLDLAHAETEARAIAGSDAGSRLLVRKEASETNFKAAGSLFSRVHFASHGEFHPNAPLRSGLRLAADAANDGLLSVGELYSLHLDADLVTLSACETGLGDVAGGDDVVGLTRGFLYAGTRSIVASLWSVDDKATAELMQAFYANLGTMDKSQALRQAQLALRRTYEAPFFWAAFQLTGQR
jgi:CHAT domain-containing protein